MNEHSQPPLLAPSCEAELRVLTARWEQGYYQPYEEKLALFVERHRDEILQLAHETSPSLSLPIAVKCMIGQRGSVDMPSELRDQLGEIHKDIWYHGESGDYDRARIKQDWAIRHAKAWRNWRLKEYAYVVDHCAERLVALLTVARPKAH